MKKANKHLASITRARSWAADIFVSVLLVVITVYSSSTNMWPFTVSVSILGLALLAYLRMRPLSKRQLEARRSMITAEIYSSTHHVLNGYYDNEINAFINSMDNIGKGYYEKVIDDIPMSSIDCIEKLESSGFVVYVTDTRKEYYNTKRGKAYLEACYNAGRNERIDFTRLFVLDAFESLTQELLELMKEHVKNGIRVLVTEKNAIDILQKNIVIDFGLFDNILLMKFAKTEKRSAKLEAHYKDSEVAKYKNIKDQLEQLQTYENFMAALYRPINGNVWAGILAKSLTLDVPYGLSRTDATTIVKEALGGYVGDKPKVLVLGLTPVLIDEFNRENAEVWSVDQTNIAPKGVDRERHTFCNWLKFDIPQEFHAIVSDEGINNLSLLQYRPFFYNLYKHLKEDGRLVMRAMCRVSGWENHSSVDEFEALSMIKNANNTIEDKDAAAEMLRLIHSEEFGFNKKTSMVNPSQWNVKVQSWLDTGEINKAIHEKWTFPYVLKLSSPTLETLTTIPRGLFVVREFATVDRDYCPERSHLEPFYRIASWTKHNEQG